MNLRAPYALCTVSLSALLLVWACPALACSYIMDEWTLPTMGSRVPSNTRIWLYVQTWDEGEVLPSDAFVLEDIDGNVVPTQLDQISLGFGFFRRMLCVVTPLEPLLIGSEYRVTGNGRYYSTPAHFVVTDGPDLKPPRKPKEVYRGKYAAGSDDPCGEVATVTMGYELESLLEELMVVAVDDHHSFEPESLSGTLFEAASAADPWFEGLAWVDYGNTPVSGWPDSNPTTVRSRVGTFDLAGNFSGWSEPTIVDLPPIPDNCAVTAPGSGGAGRWLMAISMILSLTVAVRMQRARRLHAQAKALSA